MRIGIISALALSSVSVIAQEVPVVHSPSYTSVGTVTISQHYQYHKRDTVYVLSTAAGFSTPECDFVTPFSAVQIFESEEAYSDGRKTMEVTVNGETYTARFRSHGFYPLGLNLACLDLIPNANGPASLVRLDVKNITPDYVITHEVTFSRLAGMPIVDKSNDVVGIYVDPETVIWGHDINRFLKLVVGGSPKLWPELRKR